MKLHEHQSKEIFARYGIPTPKGKVAYDAESAREIAKELGRPVVVKAQVLVGGRGKAGGVKLAASPDQAEQYAEEILGMNIKGLPVRKVLIDPAVPNKAEVYLGIVVDRTKGAPVMMASSAGGMEIEEVARVSPEKIMRQTIDPVLGLQPFEARELGYGIGLDKKLVPEFAKIALALYRVFADTDASLVEINPLFISKEDKLIAADGKLVLDDSALDRHHDLEMLRDADEENEAEREARRAGLSFVKLEGNIGCMVNGAGLAMATMDVIKFYGGEPANFLDIGGGAKAEKVAAALRIILSDPNVKAVLLNIFGGITRGDEVARGIVEALNQVKTDVPMVARIVGTNAEEGRRILANANLRTAPSLEEGAKMAVEIAKSR
ncbi:MAG: ADP-forming succinate--CoA ligase subunit beta [Chloroflexota bacterium]|nr:MAG: ADP-forming succinate--CoA ligase subunit beta [Chloroflexota bacterium]